jgi:predicted transcriptional regulator
MAKTRSRSEEVRSLTHVELELMTIVWRLGEASVAEVIASLPRERELAYTSVSTILRILESKGVLEARREGRGHIYVPVLSRNAYEARAVQDVVTRVFEGAPVALVRQLVDNVELSAEDLREIRKLLARIEEPK